MVSHPVVQTSFTTDTNAPGGKLRPHKLCPTNFTKSAGLLQLLLLLSSSIAQVRVRIRRFSSRGLELNPRDERGDDRKVVEKQGVTVTRDAWVNEAIGTTNPNWTENFLTLQSLEREIKD